MPNKPKNFHVSGIGYSLNCPSSQQNFSAEIKQIDPQLAGFIFCPIPIWRRQSAPHT
jgi:hypothetical protein